MGNGNHSISQRLCSFIKLNLQKKHEVIICNDTSATFLVCYYKKVKTFLNTILCTSYFLTCENLSRRKNVAQPSILLILPLNTCIWWEQVGLEIQKLTNTEYTLSRKNLGCFSFEQSLITMFIQLRGKEFLKMITLNLKRKHTAMTHKYFPPSLYIYFLFSTMITAEITSYMLSIYSI